MQNTKISRPEFFENISIDRLLEGYLREPVVSARYFAACSESQERTISSLLSNISSRIRLGPQAACMIEIILGEAVQNISQHCNGESDVRLYISPKKKSFIGAMELNGASQFGTEEHARYMNLLEKAYQKSQSGEYGNDISNYILGMEDEDEDMGNLTLGTIMIMRAPGVKKVGVADIGKRAYFFFEYGLD